MRPKERPMGSAVTPTGYKPKEFGPTVTRTAGVMTLAEQVERLQAASVLQGAWRRAHYGQPADFDPKGEPDGRMVPPSMYVDEHQLVDEARMVVNGMAKKDAILAARQKAEAREKARQEAEAERERTQPPEDGPKEQD